MKSSKLLIVVASIAATLAGVEIFGQGKIVPAPSAQPRYQISAGDAANVYAIDTQSGKLWGWNPDVGFRHVGTIPEEK